MKGFASKTDRKEIDLLEYVRIVIKRKWVVVTFAAVLVALAAVLSFTWTPLYRATATLLIEEPGGVQHDQHPGRPQRRGLLPQRLPGHLFQHPAPSPDEPVARGTGLQEAQPRGPARVPGRGRVEGRPPGRSRAAAAASRAGPGSAPADRPRRRCSGKGLIHPDAVDANVILAALVGAVIWNLTTWYFGLPSSSSHALLGGYGGAAVAKAGAGALIASGWIKPILFIVISPLLGMSLGLGLTVALSWALRKQSPGPMDKLFRRLQLLSAALYSLSHGANDAQKTMGIIVGLLVATQALFLEQTGWLRHFYLPNADEIPMWVVLIAHTAIALWTAMGGWRIVKTMGTRITKLRPFGGFCAE